MAEISVIVPVYRAEGTLRELYARLRASLEPIAPDFEIILVDDRSPDGSWAIIEELSKADPRVRGLRFTRNFGQHHGITAGLDQCTGNWAVVMDCDLQDRPEEIPALYAKAKQSGCDVVHARRMGRKHSFWKRMSSRAFYHVLNFLADSNYCPEVGNFSIVSRRVVQSFRGMREQVRAYSVMVDWMGYPTEYIDVQHAERGEGKSTYTLGKLLTLALDIIISYSDKPLRVSIFTGAAIATASFLYGAYIILRALTVGVPVAGWSSLIVSVFFTGGFIIADLGLIGIYIGKIFKEAKARPLYIISQSTDK